MEMRGTWRTMFRSRLSILCFSSLAKSGFNSSALSQALNFFCNSHLFVVSKAMVSFTNLNNISSSARKFSWNKISSYWRLSSPLIGFSILPKLVGILYDFTSRIMSVVSCEMLNTWVAIFRDLYPTCSVIGAHCGFVFWEGYLVFLGVEQRCEEI